MIWTDGFLVRVPGLKLNDQVSTGTEARCACPEEGPHTLIEMLQMNPFDDTEGQDHVVWT